MKRSLLLIAAAGAMLAVSACATFQTGPIGNPSVPEPTKPVELNRYLGLWYEIGRYDNGFERGCEGVTAEYTLRDDGLIGVRNSCRHGAVDGPLKVSEGRAKVVDGSGNARLKVSFFGPFYVGDYWVLDHAEDYSWSIVGEPRGRYLWLLSRQPAPSQAARDRIVSRARELGYDTAFIRPVQQSPAD